jgi:curved DNA-binding protein CbpA
MSVPDHYATLGVRETASQAEIRAARRQLLRVHHPDVSASEEDAARSTTIAILVAGKVLLNRHARAAYDRELARSRPLRRRDAARQQASDAVSPHRTDAGTRDISCPSCHRPNVRTKRHYCIFCGDGIGPTPRPITIEHLRAEPAPDSVGFDVGCGALLGGVIGTVVTLRIARASDVSPAIAFIAVTVPAAIAALAVRRYREQIWDRLSDLVTKR